MNFYLTVLLFIGVASAALVPSQTGVDHRESVEIALREAANAYRQQNGLPALACDRTVQLVAQMHAYDAVLNPSAVSGNCNLHSWGAGFTGTPYTYKACCYSHANAVCMWDKGKELNPNFPKNIYENAYSGGVTNADSILNAWKNSPGHNNVILNLDIWKDITWVSMGAGVASATGSTRGSAFLIFSDGQDQTFEVMIGGVAVDNCAAINPPSPSPTSSPATAVSPSSSPAASPAGTSASSSPAASPAGTSASSSPAAGTSASNSPAAGTSASSSPAASPAGTSASNSPAAASPSSSNSAAAPSASPSQSIPASSDSSLDSDELKECLSTCVDERKACGKQAKKDHKGDAQDKRKALKKCRKQKKKCRKRCRN